MSSDSPPPIEEAISIIYAWWRLLHQKGEDEETRGAGPNLSGERAALRRCTTPEAVVMERGYQRLRQHLQNKNMGAIADQHDRLAPIALVLSHVRADDSKSRHASFGTTCGGATEGQKSPVSEARFQRLLRLDEVSEAASSIRRILPLVNNQVGVKKLSEDLYFWSASVRRRWANDYYDAAPNL